MSLWSWEKKEDDQSYKLATENVKLQQKINHLEDQIKKYQERLESEFASASFSVDWNAMNVFSIERNITGLDGTKTILGYLLSEPYTTSDGSVTSTDVVREWTLYCSHQEHERLVAEFNEYRNSK
jgi:hypothetical protein